MALTPEQKRLMKGGISGSVGSGSAQADPRYGDTTSGLLPALGDIGAGIGGFIDKVFRSAGAAQLGPMGVYENEQANARARKNTLSGSGSSAGDSRPNFGPAATLQEDIEGAELRREQKETPQVIPDGGGGGNDVSSIFGPLFKALDQQRSNAKSRYSANVTGITNIYGQLIGARNDDVTTIDAAYKRLQKAAATRGENDLNAMSDRQASRDSENSAVLQSMGAPDPNSLPDSGAGENARNAEIMNQSNWSGMLDSMGAASQDMARADAASFGFRQGEDIARLQGNKEDFLQGVDNQEFQLKSQQAQAQQQARQAAAANAASAAATAQRAQQAALASDEKSLNAFLDSADPMTVTIVRGTRSGMIDERTAIRIQTAYQGYLDNMSVQPEGAIEWTSSLAAQDFRLSPFAEQLSGVEKSLIESAIRKTF